MTEEEKREKYKRIRSKIRIICAQIDDLSAEVSSLESALNTNFTIQNKGVEQEKIEKINSLSTKANESLRNVVLPSLYKKIV